MWNGKATGWHKKKDEVFFKEIGFEEELDFFENVYFNYLLDVLPKLEKVTYDIIIYQIVEEGIVLPPDCNLKEEYKTMFRKWLKKYPGLTTNFPMISLIHLLKVVKWCVEEAM